MATDLTTAEVFDYYRDRLGTDHLPAVRKAIAQDLGTTYQAISMWPARVPEGRAWQLQVLTDGALKARNDSDRTAPQVSGEAAA